MSSRALAERPPRHFKSTSGYSPPFRQSHPRDKQRTSRERYNNASQGFNNRNNAQNSPMWGQRYQSAENLYGPGILQLHHEIRCFFRDILPQHEDHQLRDRIVKDISSAVKDEWPSAKVEVFGSFKTGLYLPTSDIDLVIDGAWNSPPLYKLKDVLVKRQFCLEIKVINTASVPIIKLVHRLARTKVDIGFNIQNVHDSARLIQNYVRTFPVLSCLVMVLKQFLSQHDLNEVYTGGLSSYSLCLMLISFLQTHPRHEGRSMSANCGALLVEFFYRYGCSFNYNTTAISIKHGGYIARHNAVPHQETIMIFDPFCPSNDVARGSYNFARVRQTFASAFNMLYLCLCAPPCWHGILSRVIRLPVTSIPRPRRRSSTSKNSLSSQSSIQHSSSSSPDAHIASSVRNGAVGNSSAEVHDVSKSLSFNDAAESQLCTGVVSGAVTDDSVTDLASAQSHRLSTSTEEYPVSLCSTLDSSNQDITSKPVTRSHLGHSVPLSSDKMPCSSVPVQLMSSHTCAVSTMTGLKFLPVPILNHNLSDRAFVTLSPSSVASHAPGFIPSLNGVPILHQASMLHSLVPSSYQHFLSPVSDNLHPLKSLSNGLLCEDYQEVFVASPLTMAQESRRVVRSSSVPCMDDRFLYSSMFLNDSAALVSLPHAPVSATSSPVFSSADTVMSQTSPESVSTICSDSASSSVASISHISEPVLSSSQLAESSSQLAESVSQLAKSVSSSCQLAESSSQLAESSSQLAESSPATPTSSPVSLLDDTHWPQLNASFIPQQLQDQPVVDDSVSRSYSDQKSSRSDTALYVPASFSVAISAWPRYMTRTYSQACLQPPPPMSLPSLERTVSLNCDCRSNCSVSARRHPLILDGTETKRIPSDCNDCKQIISPMCKVSLR